MTDKEKINRLRSIQRCTPIHTRDDTRDFEALEAAIEAIKKLGEIESRLENVLKEIEEGTLADNRLMAVSGMSIEELTDAFTKGYRLVGPDGMRVTRVTIDEARIIFQMGKEMGHLHRSLVDELDKETEPQEGSDNE